jgi:hypothetical protein
MRRRKKILIIVACVLGLFLIRWLTLPGKPPIDTVSFLVATNGPKARQGFCTAFLTNNTASSIGLEPLLVQLEDQEGRVLNNLGEGWSDKDGKLIFTLPPKSVATVSPQADPNHKRIRIVCEYSCDASAFPRFLSGGIRRLPLRPFPPGLRMWLGKHGFADGKLHGQVESSWILNPASETTHLPSAFSEGKGP